MTKTIFHEFTITATYKGGKPWRTAGGRYPANYNNHVVTVTNTETGKRTRFEYWGSILQGEVKTREDLLDAFYCFLSDALATIQTRDEWEFFNEFGYEPTREAHETWRACKRSEAKALRVVGDKSRLCELINEINA